MQAPDPQRRPDRICAQTMIAEPSIPSPSRSARAITLVDSRFPSGRARALAWNVVPQGQQDLSMFLCRGASGDYFLLCRPGIRPAMSPAIVPLSPTRASAWFEAQPVRFADENALR